MNKRFFIILFGIVFGAFQLHANTYQVPSALYPTIQSAIDIAMAADIIIVADGVYTGTGNVDIQLKGKPITLRSSNGPENCIIDGELQSRCFRLDNAETEHSIIEGFTIKNGYAGINEVGGGMFFSHSTASVINCIIKDNYSLYWGGGVGCQASSRPSFTECIIQDNYAKFSGGGIATKVSYPSFLECDIIGNEARFNGGGAAYVDSGGVLFFNCTIRENTTGGTGGCLDFHGDYFSIQNCTIVDNHADVKAGALSIYGNSLSDVWNSIIWNNTSAAAPEIAIMMSEGQPASVTLKNDDIKGGLAEIVVETGCVVNYEECISLDPLFIQGTAGEILLSHKDAGQWGTSPCFDTGSVISTQCCYVFVYEERCLNWQTSRTDGIRDLSRVDMGRHYPGVSFPTATPYVSPTPTPTSTPTFMSTNTPVPTDTPQDNPTRTPTPTPTVENYVGVDLVLSKDVFAPGDEFYLEAVIINNGEPLDNAPFAVLLDAYGTYFWYPHWFQTFDYQPMDINLGAKHQEILKFYWPAVSNAGSGVIFYGALLNNQFSDIVGEMDYVQFGWVP